MNYMRPKPFSMSTFIKNAKSRMIEGQLYKRTDTETEELYMTKKEHYDDSQIHLRSTLTGAVETFFFSSDNL